MNTFHFLWSFAVALSKMLLPLLFIHNGKKRDKMAIFNICKLQLKIKMLIFQEKFFFPVLLNPLAFFAHYLLIA